MWQRPLLINSPATLIALVVATLVALGVVTVYSASAARAGIEERRIVAKATNMPVETIPYAHSSAYLERQLLWVGLGIVGMMVLASVPMETVERWTPIIMIACLVMLVLVLVPPFGVTSKGATRWLKVGPISIQPAEFAKIGLVLYMARMLAQKGREIRDWWSGFVPTMGVWCVFAVLVLLERDLGTVVLMGGVMLAMWCLARVRAWHLTIIVLCSIPAVIYLILQHAYRINRLLAIWDPDKFALGIGYQLNQSLIAVGSGGLLGRGLGYGHQKYHFLSEAHTDFIFANWCEEMGLLGGVAVVLLFVAFAVLGCRVSYKAPDYFGGLAAAGLTMTISLAALINFFVVLGMAPTKGLALPFFTYGGSSMLASLMAVGILVNIANYSAQSAGGD